MCIAKRPFVFHTMVIESKKIPLVEFIRMALFKLITSSLQMYSVRTTYDSFGNIWFVSSVRLLVLGRFRHLVGQWGHGRRYIVRDGILVRYEYSWDDFNLDVGRYGLRGEMTGLPTMNIANVARVTLFTYFVLLRAFAQVLC